MRLIDAAAEIERLESDFCKKCEKRKPYPIFGVGCCLCGIQDAVEILDDAPTIEAEPVLHGKLLEGKAFNDQHCSVCGQRFHDEILFILPSDENGFHMPKRCPECGCYWDGGAEDG